MSSSYSLLTLPEQDALIWYRLDDAKLSEYFPAAESTDPVPNVFDADCELIGLPEAA